MSEDIKVTDGTILESLNGKVDLDGGNYRGSGLENRVKNSLLNKVLFDTKLSDHVLSFEESRGWALQGTYVYKEAVAGSRYGYPDFYAKCLEEFESGEKSWLKSNVTKVGSLVDNQGVLSGFSSSSYAYIPNGKQNNNAEYVIKFTTGSTLTTSQVIFHSEGFVNIETNANGQIYSYSWGDSSHNIIINNPTPNTTYWIKIVINGNAKTFSYSTNGVAYTEAVSFVDSGLNVSAGYQLCFGINTNVYVNPFLGTIDLNECYINVNGQRFWNGTDTITKNPNGHLFYDISEKDKIDELYNTNGIAWYYGVDTENERVFLPRTKWFIQPSGEITEVNTANEAGLPNIIGTFTSDDTGGNPTGAFYVSGYPSGDGGEGGGWRIGFDASRSSSIYGNSTTVQPPSINQLLYICVGNTNVESAVTDVVDVTTTENDTVPLGYSTYQNGIVPNTSWLKSQGQWNDGNVYTTFYNEFVQKIGQPFASGYVKEITEEYDDYDLVINQDDMTFRLPLLDGSESIVDNSNVTIICDDVTSFEYTAQQNGVIRHRQRWTTDASGSQTVNLSLNGLVYPLSSNYSECTLYNIQVKKGDVISFTSNATTLTVVQYFAPYKGNGSLYFKVANAVQNLELLDAGEVLESLADKISRQDCKAYVTETYVNGTSWYRVYSDGWCEQGGVATGVISGSNTTIALLKNYKDTNYSVQVTYDSTTTGATSGASSAVNMKNTTSFAIGSQGGNYAWEAKGYII